MSNRDAWRGDRRLRVGLKMTDGSAAEVVSMWMLEGPAVQRPSLAGRYVARVDIGGRLTLLQSFEDPNLVRGIAPPEQLGHSFRTQEPATIHIDIPFTRASSLRTASIRLADLSKVADRPTDPAAIAVLFDTPRPEMRELAAITMKQLAKHPDWPTSLDEDGHPKQGRRKNSIAGAVAWLRRMFLTLGRWSRSRR